MRLFYTYIYVILMKYIDEILLNIKQNSLFKLKTIKYEVSRL